MVSIIIEVKPRETVKKSCETRLQRRAELIYSFKIKEFTGKRENRKKF